MSREFEPLAPACMKCVHVTGQSTCFPGPCRFYHERDTEGTKAHSIAVIDRARRGIRETVHAATTHADALVSGSSTGGVGR